MNCIGCQEAVTEPFVADKHCVRCMAKDAGPWRGRVVSPPTRFQEASIPAPVWCPRRKEVL